MNFLTIVADSLRYDSYVAAITPNISKHFDVVEGQPQATFTLPAHAAIFQGFYPSASVNRPLYNRFVMAPFQWFYDSPRSSVMTIKKTDNCLPAAFSRMGWSTFCIGGVGWFKKPTPLSIGFKEFEHITNGQVAVATAVQNMVEPFYGLVNFGITHRPFNCPTTPPWDRTNSGKRSGTGYGTVYDASLHRKQIQCAGYLDSILQPLFDKLLSLNDPTLVCFCGDHGECFGEDGCYGHGFYHKNVMSVPLAWSCFKSGESQLYENCI